MADICIGDANSIARELDRMYVGDANGIAREVDQIYIGDANGIAREGYTSYTPPTYSGSGRIALHEASKSGKFIEIGLLPYDDYPNPYCRYFRIRMERSSYDTSFSILGSVIDEAINNGYTKLHVEVRADGSGFFSAQGLIVTDDNGNTHSAPFTYTKDYLLTDFDQWGEFPVSMDGNIEVYSSGEEYDCFSFGSMLNAPLTLSVNVTFIK